MKKISKLFALVFCIISINLSAQDNQDEIIAIWNTKDDTQVKIYKVGDRYIGNPINKSGECNTEIELLNLEYNNGKWVGTLYSVRRNRSLDVVCKVEGDKLLLEVSAGRISRDIEWTRAS